jgi:hypothetical protein
MMATSGETAMLGAIVNHAPPEDLLLKLYVSDTKPRNTDDIGRYTEVAGFGYAPVKLAGEDWSIAEGPPARAEYPEQTFTFGGPLGKVYGYFVVQQGSGVMLWAERFTDGPYQIVFAGSQINVVPGLELSRPS